MSKLTKTTIMKAKIERKHQTMDATKVPLGRLATQVSLSLMGKRKVNYAPHLDLGDYVTVVNGKDIVLTGQKSLGKVYHHYTGYPGGIRSIKAGALKEKNPARLIKLAVKRMLPKNSLGAKMLTRLMIK
ncbi:MAG: 50S ribosomal protein L13 [bacterium]